MLKNSRAKGSKLVRKCREWWENLGYETAVVERTGRFIEEKDLFGVADIVTIKSIKGGTELCLVQVTSEKPHTLKDYKTFAKKYVSDYIKLYQFVWKKRKGWIIYTFHRDGTYTREKQY